MAAESSLSSNIIVARRAGLVEAEVDGEIVALHIDKGTCYGLNKSGSRIWQMLAEPKRIDAVCARLIAEYDVDGRPASARCSIFWRSCARRV